MQDRTEKETTVTNDINNDPELMKKVRTFMDASGLINGRSMVSLADIESAQREIKNLLPILENAAQNGSMDAQFALARYYRDDAAVCLKWTQLAAAQNLPMAMFNLGAYYLLGRKGLTQDHDKAAELFALVKASSNAEAKESVEKGIANKPDVREKIEIIEQSPEFKAKLLTIKWPTVDLHTFIREIDSLLSRCSQKAKVSKALGGVVFVSTGSMYNFFSFNDLIVAANTLKHKLLDDQACGLTERDKYVLLESDFAQTLARFEKEYGALWKPSAPDVRPEYKV